MHFELVICFSVIIAVVSEKTGKRMNGLIHFFKSDVLTCKYKF